MAAAATSAAGLAYWSAFTGTATTSWARPLKARRNPPVSLDASEPQMMTSGRWHFVFEFRHRLRERAPGILIMAAIEPNLGAGRGERRHMALGEILQAGRPLRARQAVLDGGRREMRLDGAQRSDRGCGVLMLMAADEMRQRQIEKAALVLEDKTAIFFPGVVVPPAGDQRRAQAPRFAFEHREGGIFLGAHEWRARRL